MNPSKFSEMMRKAVHLVLLRPFLRLVFGVNIVGRENLASLKQFVIIANHNSHLDILLLFFLLPITKILTTHPVAEKIYFSRSRIIFAVINFLFRPVWIERGHPDLTGDPFGKLKQRLDAGANLIIFPEGTRGKPGQLEHFKSGIGRLVVQYPELPIVPVFLAGPERSLPKTSFLLLPIWNHVTIGPPQKCRGDHRQATRLLEDLLSGLAQSEAAGRHHRRKKKPHPPLTVAFLGIDGSGKSTLSRTTSEALAEIDRVCLISDQLFFFQQGQPQPLQPLVSEKLRRAISVRAKKAGSLKSYKIPKLAELLLRNHLYYEVRRWYKPDLLVMDGAPLLNMAAWAALYKEELPTDDQLVRAIDVLTQHGRETTQRDSIFKDFPELVHLHRLGINNLVLPDAVVFLDVDPHTACQRIATRGQQRQVHETKDKLTRLREAYLKVCAVIGDHWSIPVTIINAEQSRDAVASIALGFIYEIIQSRGENEKSPN